MTIVHDISINPLKATALIAAIKQKKFDIRLQETANGIHLELEPKDLPEHEARAFVRDAIRHIKNH